MNVKTSDLLGGALDWAVAQCELADGAAGDVVSVPNCFSTDWRYGGAIIQREGIAIRKHKKTAQWYAMSLDDAGDNQKVDWVEKTYAGGKRYGMYSYQVAARKCRFDGPTPLIAAMRCYVASKFGELIDVPSELCLRDVG